MKSELEEFVWVGTEYRLLTVAEKARIKTGRKSLKTNGKSQLVYIDSPDSIDMDTGVYRKNRSRGSNFTPKKKKRK
jgi:hypothetical protein